MTTTPTPTWAGAWRLVDPPSSRWSAFLCGWRGKHVEAEQLVHIHGISDQKWCERCRAVWVRDGCVARECGERSGA